MTRKLDKADRPGSATVIRRLPAAIALALTAVAVAAAQEPPDAWPAGASDAEVEDFLRQARVVEAREIGSGITRPLRLLLEHQGRTMNAAFKDVQLYKPGARRKPGFPPETEFSDDYHFERAAYLLDRELGLNMVPVVVLRKWGGRHGAAVAWVEDAIDESERREQGRKPPDLLTLGRQQALMRVFDALILNTDRNLSNQLITPTDWKLHLIDHSRSFRLAHSLPDRFLAVPIKLSHQLLARLVALEEERLRQLFKGLISKGKIKSLLARRDKILEKVEADRARFGDGYVFSFDPPAAPAPESDEESMKGAGRPSAGAVHRLPWRAQPAEPAEGRSGP